MTTDEQSNEGRFERMFRYLESRMRAHSLKMDGEKSFEMRGGWPALRGQSFEEAVEKAMQAEDEARRKINDAAAAFPCIRDRGGE